MGGKGRHTIPDQPHELWYVDWDVRFRHLVFVVLFIQPRRSTKQGTSISYSLRAKWERTNTQET